MINNQRYYFRNDFNISYVKVARVPSLVESRTPGHSTEQAVSWEH